MGRIFVVSQRIVEMSEAFSKVVSGNEAITSKVVGSWGSTR